MKDVLEPFSDIGAPATACWCACFNFEDSSRSCDEHKAALVAEVRRLRRELECAQTALGGAE